MALPDELRGRELQYAEEADFLALLKSELFEAYSGLFQRAGLVIFLFLVSTLSGSWQLSSSSCLIDFRVQLQLLESSALG